MKSSSYGKPSQNSALEFSNLIYQIAWDFNCSLMFQRVLPNHIQISISLTSSLNRRKKEKARKKLELNLYPKKRETEVDKQEKRRVYPHPKYHKNGKHHETYSSSASVNNNQLVVEAGGALCGNRVLLKRGKN